MKKIMTGLLAAAFVAVAGVAIAQTQTLPVPSNIGTAGQVMVFTDGNNVQGTSTLSGLSSLGVGSSGTALTQATVYAPSLTPTVVTANACSEQTFTVSGVSTADKVIVNPAANTGTDSSGVSLTAARVSATDTLALTFCNVAGANETHDAGTFPTIAIRS